MDAADRRYRSPRSQLHSVRPLVRVTLGIRMSKNAHPYGYIDTVSIHLSLVPSVSR